MHHITDRALRPLWLLLISLALMCAGCEEPRIVKPLKTPDRTRQTVARRGDRRTTRTAPAQQTAIVTPVVRRTPEPRGPITLDSSFITRIEGGGTTSTDGTASLASNGAFWYDFNLNRTIRQVLVEARGQLAGGVGPLVDVTAFTVGPETKNFTLWSRDYITTNTYTEKVKDTNVPVKPGHYNIVFRYYNNSENVPPGEDRNVWLKRIILYP